jgi:hypothetical protein
MVAALLRVKIKQFKNLYAIGCSFGNAPYIYCSSRGADDALAPMGPPAPGAIAPRRGLN